MKLTEAQFKLVEDLLPTSKGNVRLDNLHVLNAILYVTANGCQWRALPQRFGKWNTVYTRMMRWSRAGILDRVFERLQREQIVRVHIEVSSSDVAHNSQCARCSRALSKSSVDSIDPAAIEGRLRYIWLPRMAGTFRPEQSALA